MSTTSIRINDELHHRLREFAERSELTKNGIIIHAIREYLDRQEASQLAEQARRQSLLSAEYDAKVEDDRWDGLADDSGCI